MAVLSQADFLAAFRFLGDAEAVAGPDPFPSELLDRLRGLVRCDAVWYGELDEPGRRDLGRVLCARAMEVRALDPEEESRTFWRLKHQHPLSAYHARTGDFSARKLSDFVTRKQLHGLEIYSEFFRPSTVEYQLEVGLPAPPWHTKVFGFHSASHDFGERERFLLNLLRPHLTHFYAHAKMRRLAAALAAGTEAPAELVVLDATGRIEFATLAARQLLRDYGESTDGTRLPHMIEEWLRHDSRRLNGDSLPAPGRFLHIDRQDSRLVVTRLNGHQRTLLLTQEPVRPAYSGLLSWREWQVIGLVEAGKSNVEIAAELWIAPGTVRKHLENIYAKLAVRSRTAALARVRQLKLSHRAPADQTAPQVRLRACDCEDRFGCGAEDRCCDGDRAGFLGAGGDGDGEAAVGVVGGGGGDAVEGDLGHLAQAVAGDPHLGAGRATGG
jgi:DNA-binding CsgD family transcriptional regulator